MFSGSSGCPDRRAVWIVESKSCSLLCLDLIEVLQKQRVLCEHMRRRSHGQEQGNGAQKQIIIIIIIINKHI